MSRILNNQKAYSLVEIIVSIAVIALLSGTFIANYHGGGIRSELIGATQKLSSDIRLAQNNALGTKEFNNSVPLGGWGAHFDLTKPDQYIIFADNNENSIYDTGEEDRIIKLVRNVKFQSFSEVSPINIIFLPPDPKTIIKANGIDKNSVNLTLEEATNHTAKSVAINFLGLIDVVN